MLINTVCGLCMTLMNTCACGRIRRAVSWELVKPLLKACARGRIRPGISRTQVVVPVMSVMTPMVAAGLHHIFTLQLLVATRLSTTECRFAMLHSCSHCSWRHRWVRTDTLWVKIQSCSTVGHTNNQLPANNSSEGRICSNTNGVRWHHQTNQPASNRCTSNNNSTRLPLAASSLSSQTCTSRRSCSTSNNNSSNNTTGLPLVAAPLSSQICQCQ